MSVEICEAHGRRGCEICKPLFPAQSRETTQYRITVWFDDLDDDWRAKVWRGDDVLDLAPPASPRSRNAPSAPSDTGGRSMASRSDTEAPDRVAIIREVLIQADDIVPVGDEPFVGWSLVLAERIDAALNGEGA